MPWKSLFKKFVIIVFLMVVVFTVFYHASHILWKRETVSVTVWTQQRQNFDAQVINRTKTIGTSDKNDPYLIPSDDILQQMSEDDLLRMYWKYMNTVQILCRTHTRVGILGDGGKEMCVDPQYIPKQPCIVYSFGSNFQFDFDLAMHNHYGCEVFTYDPSMNLKGRAIPTEIKFELRGLAGRDYINDKNWKMNSLETIFNDNGHTNKIIDVLKIDVEGSEWEALPAMLEAGLDHQVKQLLVEIHGWRRSTIHDRVFFGGINMAEQLKILRQLYEHGFRIFMREHNLGSRTKFSAPPQDHITTVNELSLVNISFR